MHKVGQDFQLRQVLLLAIISLLLFSSWVILFFWIREFAILSMIPYDDVMPEARPSPRTWQRQLNDFFERSPWRQVPAWLITGSSIVAFLIVLVRSSLSFSECTRFSIMLAILNFSFISAMVLISVVLASVRLTLPFLNPPYDYHPGYGWTFKFILADILLLGIWLTAQVWLVSKSLR